MPGDRAVAAQPQRRDAHRQAADDERPARVGRDRAGRRRHHVHLPRRLLQQGLARSRASPRSSSASSATARPAPCKLTFLKPLTKFDNLAPGSAAATTEPRFAARLDAGAILYIFTVCAPTPRRRPAAVPPTAAVGAAQGPRHRRGRSSTASRSDQHEALRRRLGHARAGRARGARCAPETQVIEEHVKSILAGNDSPDIGFDLSINPYRGCEHGCIYCFARPTHSYLNLSPGLDFETRIIAKVNAAERLREALASRGYEPMLLNIGSATDAYQPVERELRITRSVIEVLAECRHPFSLVTKSSGVERDLDLIAPMAAAAAGRGLRLDHHARPAAGAHPGAARRRAAPPAAHDRDAGQGRRAGRRERVADHPVHQRAGDRAHPRGGARRRRHARRSASCCACRGR